MPVLGIMGNLPHRVDVLREERITDELGGKRRRWNVLSRSVPCWVQTASDREVSDFEARGVQVSTKVYFAGDNAACDERDLLRFTQPETGEVQLLECRAFSDRGVNRAPGPYRAMCSRWTADSDAPLEP